MDTIYTMTAKRFHCQNCIMCDEYVGISETYYLVPKHMDRCIDGRDRRALIHTSCASVSAEVNAAAQDLAKRGLTGDKGDALPNLMSPAAAEWINQHGLSFRQLVSHFATLKRLYKPSTYMATAKADCCFGVGEVYPGCVDVHPIGDIRNFGTFEEADECARLLAAGKFPEIRPAGEYVNNR